VGDGTACGFTGEGAAEAACLYTSPYSPAGEDPTGDLGYCAKLCDCDEECSAVEERCVDESEGAIEALWSRKGYCRPLQPGEDETIAIPVCVSDSREVDTAGDGD
jgi:hypothetical protein